MLAVCYDIRHAYMGDREVKLVDNGVHDEMMKWHSMILPKQEVHYAVKFLFRKLFSWHYPLRIFIYGRNPVMDRGPKSRKRLLNFRLKENQGKMSFLNYATQYVDKCNLEYLRTIPEKRKDKLRNIAKRFINQPTSYQNLKSDFEYSAKQYGCSIHELYDSKMEYPEEIEW